METDRISFVTQCVGKNFSRLHLGAFIQSLLDVYEDNFNLYLQVSDIDNQEELLKKISNKVKNLTLIQKKDSQIRDSDGGNRNPWAKILECWTPAIESMKPGSKVLLIDCDTILLKPIDHFFEEDFDIGFTFYKNHSTPYGDRSFTKNKRNRVNTGVMLCKTSDQCKNFFNKFASTTKKFVEDVNPLENEFLAPDQDALMWILSNEGKDWEQPYSAKFDLDGDFIRRGSNSLKVKPFSCRELNEPESIGKIHEENHIIHYKGGWRTILFKLAENESNWRLFEKTPRKKSNSEEQFKVWKEKFLKWNS